METAIGFEKLSPAGVLNCWLIDGHSMLKALCASLLVLPLAITVQGASSENLESYRLEIAGSSWLLNTAGNVQSGGAAIDFIHDLGFEQQRPTFYGKIVFKPGRKHKIVLEGSPLTFNGLNTIHRSVTYEHQNFNVDETLKTNADLTYLYGGYQYDLLSGRWGHFGLSAGAAYVNATAMILSTTEATTAMRNQKLGLPLAGTDFRIFPLPGHKWVGVDGGIRGMSFGQYGHFAEGTANAGVWLGPFILRGGYQVINAMLQETGSNAGGITARMKGPIFSLGFNW